MCAQGERADEPWLTVYSLKMIQAVWESEDQEGRTNYQFAVLVRNQEWFLRAPSAEAKSAWISALARCCRLLPGRP